MLATSKNYFTAMILSHFWSNNYKVSPQNTHAAQALKWKHEVKKTRWVKVNLAQQMPISCSSWPLCLLSCTSQDKRLDKKTVHLSQHLSCQQEHKNIRGCRTSQQPVMWRRAIEVRAQDVFCFLFFFKSNFPVGFSIHLFFFSALD